MSSQFQIRREVARVIAEKGAWATKARIMHLKRENFNLPSEVLKKDIVREIEAIYRIRAERARNAAFVDPLIRAKHTRLPRIKSRYISYARFAGNYIDRDRGDMREVFGYNGSRRMAVVGVDSWVNYTRSYGTRVNMSGLVLLDRDTGEYRFLRVGPQIRTIDAALDYIKPAAVRKAEREGKEVKRQGDIYFIPQRAWNLSALHPTNHAVEIAPSRSGAWMPWDGEEKLNGKPVRVCHPHHGCLTLTAPHKAAQQVIVANVSFRHGGGRVSGHAD